MVSATAISISTAAAAFFVTRELRNRDNQDDTALLLPAAPPMRVMEEQQPRTAVLRGEQRLSGAVVQLREVGDDLDVITERQKPLALDADPETEDRHAQLLSTLADC